MKITGGPLLSVMNASLFFLCCSLLLISPTSPFVPFVVSYRVVSVGNYININFTPIAYTDISPFNTPFNTNLFAVNDNVNDNVHSNNVHDVSAHVGFEKMKVGQLRDLANENGLDCKGLKKKVSKQTDDWA